MLSDFRDFDQDRKRWLLPEKRNGNPSDVERDLFGLRNTDERLLKRIKLSLSFTELVISLLIVITKAVRLGIFTAWNTTAIPLVNEPDLRAILTKLCASLRPR